MVLASLTSGCLDLGLEATGPGAWHLYGGIAGGVVIGFGDRSPRRTGFPDPPKNVSSPVSGLPVRCRYLRWINAWQVLQSETRLSGAFEPPRLRKTM